MYAFLIVVHVLVCLFLIMVVLLQAGRGTGMSDMFGGAQANTLLGTQTNSFMTKLTEVCAVLFVVTSIALNIATVQRGKSLMAKKASTITHKMKVTATDDLQAVANKVAQSANESVEGVTKAVAETAGANPVSEEDLKKAAADAKKIAEETQQAQQASQS